MSNPLETMKWLAAQFRDRADEDPDTHTEADAQQVEELYTFVLDMMAALRVDLSMMTDLKSALLVGAVSDPLWISRAQMREHQLLALINRVDGDTKPETK